MVSLILVFSLLGCAKDEKKSSSSPSYITSSSGATASGSLTVGSETASGSYTTICRETSSSETGGPSDTKAVGVAIVITGDSSAQQETYYYTDSSVDS